MVNNSGAEQIDFNGLVGKNALADLDPAARRAEPDDPNKTVRDTLLPGVVEVGSFDGKPVWILNYAYTAYGIWYSKTKLLTTAGAEYPKTWDDMLALCEKTKMKGIAPLDLPGQAPRT